MRVPNQAGLYEVDSSVPALIGTRCGTCQATFYPPLTIGCATCGSVALVPVTLGAAGELYSFATVHRHRGKDIETPFTVGEISLDDGPLVRGLMTANDGYAIGDRVVAEWVVVGANEAGEDIVEPRFGTTK
jgi:uncharacterized protein